MDYIANFNTLLNNFNIQAICNNYQEAGNYFYYDVQLLPKTKVKDLQKYSNEIAMSLRVSIPNIKIIPEQGIVRLEFCKPNKDLLTLKPLLDSNPKPAQYKIPCLLGQAVDGSLVWMDLYDNPHMLVAGTTGSGKSSLLHNIIANVIHYQTAKLFLVDPKQVEFCQYKNHVHVYDTYNQTVELIQYLLDLMNHRFTLLRNGESIKRMLPCVLIIDEFASLILQDEDSKFYNLLLELSQKCRAANIFIILATQRPSVQIINGNIKANFPARIACKVASQIDSKIILDTSGAENLSGKGDSYLKDNLRLCQRFQVAYMSPEQILSMCQEVYERNKKFLSNQSN